ncbi:hypothetical protein ALO95_200080 [Pseudomonas syringae pv. antirrhini]|uniref:hypothetical protein n=1 Tax=Pseudomonas syringae group genomosp. 3 TaxID=251701 RepID=UPI000EFA8F8A|nr:hypothetical protein [Pseudomonas syringae group genomosp. 3]RMP44295.1 hypothetical protein ALQ23_200107 [Pseudomonas syringae pv. antirrhini]RMW26026.1 hypothetical protein ALO95_200080 [Pseudomonas syringae pv. antirrhini]
MTTEEEFETDEASDRTPEELAEDFKKALKELNWSAVALADRMVSLGDYRPYKTILRGINRALEGQIKVSGELLALTRQMVRFKRRLQRTYGQTVWTQLGDGSHTTKIEDFTITLVPKSKGRWLVNLVHETGYSPAWPRWQNSLDDAKNVAFVTLDNAQNWLLEYHEQ